VIKLQQFKARCMVALNHKNIKKEYKTLFALTKSHHPVSGSPNYILIFTLLSSD